MFNLTRSAKISFFCTLLSLPTMFLMITILIFPALGFFIGIKAYRQYMNEKKGLEERSTIIAAQPMIFAVVAFVLEICFVNGTYRA